MDYYDLAPVLIVVIVQIAKTLPDRIVGVTSGNARWVCIALAGTFVLPQAIEYGYLTDAGRIVEEMAEYTILAFGAYELFLKVLWGSIVKIYNKIF